MMFLVVLVTAGAGGHPPGERGGGDIHLGPFLQNATPDGIWVVWETTEGQESLVEYGLTPELGSVATGQSIPSVGAARIHHTQLTGLVPDTRYHYQVTTKGVSSRILHFRTPPLASAELSFRFVACSDTQLDTANPHKHAEIIDEGIIAYVTSHWGEDMADEVAFVMNAGDLVENGNAHEQWKTQFFDEAQSLLQHVPLYPVFGNHENDSPLYLDYFNHPDNGSAGFLEHWYYVDYGNVRIIGLDSNEPYQIQTQLDWLDGVLAEAVANDDIDFVFAQLHHPHKSELWTGVEREYTGLVIARLEAFSSSSGKPSVHFFGHAHAYSRGQSRNHRHLWVDVASGGGIVTYWGEYSNADYPEFQRSFPGWGFVMVEVEAGPSPQFTLRRLDRGNDIVARDNEEVDSITVRLNNGAPEKPRPQFPVDGQTLVAPGSPSLRAFPFEDPDGDTHLESQFQLTLTPGDYAAPVQDRWIRFENWYAPPGATGHTDGYFSVNTVEDPDITRIDLDPLDGGVTHHWRVRYRDSGLEWSDWSEEASFTTIPFIPTPNLLTNAGAEAGVIGWVVLAPPLEALEEGECGTDVPAAGGSSFFAVGGVCAGEGAYGEAMQVIGIEAFAPAVDTGELTAIFGGFMRNRSGSDLPESWLVFRDDGGILIETTEKLSNPTAAWITKLALAPVPIGTRTVEIHVSGTRLDGTENDAYFDELTLMIADASCPADLNGTGDVGFADLVLLLATWGPCSGCPADLDASGAVGFDDLLEVLAAWGPCP